MNTHRFNRRAFLRGASVTMALPWMESVNVWGDEPKKNKPASEAPVRLCVTFSGNGFQSKEWWAKGEGKAMELGRVLEPLKDFRERLLFVRGLYHEEARKGNIHSSQTGNMLSGAPIANGCLDVNSSQSPATIVHQHLASDETAVNNRRTGTERLQGFKVHNLTATLAPPSLADA